MTMNITTMNTIYPSDENRIAQCIRHRANSLCGYHIMPHTAQISKECQQLCDGLPEHAIEDSASDEGSPPREVGQPKKTESSNLSKKDSEQSVREE